MSDPRPPVDLLRDARALNARLARAIAYLLDSPMCNKAAKSGDDHFAIRNATGALDAAKESTK